VGAPFHDRFHAAEEPAPGRCPVCIAAAPVQDLPTRLHLADGARRSVECSARPNGDGTQPVARVLSFRDTEQRRALEARLREAQRMESIGRFVGGVAHEFNNLLTPIVGGMSVARAALGPDHSLHATLGNLERAGERAAGLVRQLLASGRRIELAREPVDLTATIRQVLALLRPTLDRRITVSFQPSRDAWVLADPGQVHQVVLNLCLNARDAVAAHAAGPMAISVATRRLAPEETGGRTGEWIELDVSDTGPGIPADVLPRIWEPFFTTKRLGDGSGLGLAVTHGIVTQHGGWIAVETEVGRGASFRCAFPAAAARDAPEPEPAPAGRAHGGAAILVVDDEELVRSTIRTMLEPVGYDVHEADCGEAAVARLAEGFRPDAILLDLLMPGIDGWDTLVAIRSIVGAIPVIVISGYDARHSGAIGPTGVAPEPEARLSKPFQVAALMDTLASVIRRDRPASV
jgi:signal transduction histidine kinase